MNIFIQRNFTSLCPKTSERLFISHPASMQRVAKVCLKQWSPAFLYYNIQDIFELSCIYLGSMQLLFCLSKSTCRFCIYQAFYIKVRNGNNSVWRVAFRRENGKNSFMILLSHFIRWIVLLTVIVEFLISFHSSAHSSPILKPENRSVKIANLYISISFKRYVISAFCSVTDNTFISFSFL